MPAGGTALVVFDLDGTLIDSAGDIADCLNSALEQHGISSLPEDTVRTMIGAGAKVLVGRALQAHSISAKAPLVESLVAAFEARYLELGAGRSKPYPGARQLLDALAARGIKMAVCTNKPDGVAGVVIEALGLADYFEMVLGVRAGLARKPAPDMLAHIMERLNCPTHACLVVGDSDMDVGMARAKGVKVIVVSYGYSQVPAAQLGGDGVIDNLLDTLEFLD